MSMGLARQSFSLEPEYLIAGTTIRTKTGVKTAAVALEKGTPVILDSDGKAAKVTATTSGDKTTVSTTGLYGIVADSAEKDEDVVIYLTGEFFADALVLETGVTAGDLEVAFRNMGIFLK